MTLFVNHIYLGLGVGGMERMVAYPIIFWVIEFGPLPFNFKACVKELRARTS
jgi:hypothetical protein